MKTNNHIKDMNEVPSEGKILTLCTAAYNVGRYIERNIKSVIRAKKNREIELLIVNDGSKDNTGIVVQKYMKLYPELF